jgi:hypothetical protein
VEHQRQLLKDTVKLLAQEEGQEGQFALDVANSVNRLSEFAGTTIYAAEESRLADELDLRRELQLSQDVNKKLRQELEESKRREGELAASCLSSNCERCEQLERQLEEERAEREAQRLVMLEMAQQLASQPQPSMTPTPSQGHGGCLVQFRGCGVAWPFPNPQEEDTCTSVAVSNRELQAAFLRTSLEIFPQETRGYLGRLFTDHPVDSFVLRRPWQAARENTAQVPAPETVLEEDVPAYRCLVEVRRAFNLV